MTDNSSKVLTKAQIRRQSVDFKKSIIPFSIHLRNISDLI